MQLRIIGHCNQLILIYAIKETNIFLLETNSEIHFGVIIYGIMSLLEDS